MKANLFCVKCERVKLFIVKHDVSPLTPCSPWGAKMTPVPLWLHKKHPGTLCTKVCAVPCLVCKTNLSLLVYYYIVKCAKSCFLNIMNIIFLNPYFTKFFLHYPQSSRVLVKHKNVNIYNKLRYWLHNLCAADLGLSPRYTTIWRIYSYF